MLRGMTKYCFRDMLVEDAMTPADKIFMLSEDEHLNFEVSVTYSMHVLFRISRHTIKIIPFTCVENPR